MTKLLTTDAVVAIVAMVLIALVGTSCKKQSTDDDYQWTQTDCVEFSAENGYSEVRCPNGRLYHD